VKIFGEFRRRSFLVRCCQASAAILLPASLRRPALPFPASPHLDFHLHPQYREQSPLDPTLLQIKPGLDGFLVEEYHDRFAAIFDDWSTSLLQSPQQTAPIEHVLSSDFSGSSWQPVESAVLRSPASGLQVRRLHFSSQSSLSREAFLRGFRSTIGTFSKLFTAEFQITNIISSSSLITTHVRYQLAGTGQDFYREQRVGDWSIEWAPARNNDFVVTRWQALKEIRSRSSRPFYSDVSRSSFGANTSYSSQLLHGADYWRTILDTAAGIDIYGHNGVSVGDIDNDGLDDIYICQPAGLPNRLYRNLGNGAFEDITEASGTGVIDNTACALFADFDNNGWQDLVVIRAAGPLLFINQRNGKFRLKADAFQFASPPQGTFTGAAAADYNRDGLLDIYFCLYAYYQGADQYRYPTPYFAAENGPPNFLMHNNGDGTFRDVTKQSGLDRNNTRYSFCCAWSDYNRDGWPDLYVVNDFGRKNLYRNNGDGTFSDVAPQAGVEDVGAGMSVCWLDYDNDGAEDLYVADMWTAAGERITHQSEFQQSASKQDQAFYRKHAMGNSLFQNVIGSGFRDVTEESHAGMGRWSWSADSWDFDHDGFPDLYIANGMISGPLGPDLNSFFWRQVVAKSPNTARADTEYEQGWNAINELVRSDYSWSGFERNVFYANNRDGSFSDVSGALGLDFIEDGRAFALADFDADGRQEFLLKNRNAPQVRLMKNIVPDLPPSISFRLSGTKSNRDAIGAAITLKTTAGQQTRFLQAGSGFLSQHSKELFFGLGEAKAPLSAIIRWPSGLLQQLNNLPVNHRIWVTEGLEPSRVEPFQTSAQTTPSEGSSPGELLPETSETWLLVPVPSPVPTSSARPHLLTIDTADEQAAIYNLLFRYLFDRHRDMLLPTSFLIDKDGQIVKVYEGPVDQKTVEHDLRNIPRTQADRLAKALPFPGVTATYEYGRNYLSLAAIFFQHGYIEPAAEFFQSALKTDPASAEAFYGLGSVYLKQEKTAQARDCFERAATLKPAYPNTTANAWNNLGLLSAREGDTLTAITYFTRALQIDADHFVALENLGNAYKQQGRWDEARTTLEHALAIKPSDAEANYSLGMVFAQLDDTERAYKYLEKALQARPIYPEALNNLGVLYLRTRRRDEAVGAFEKCIHVAPAFAQSYLNLAKVYAIEGDTAKAREVLLALLAQHPDHALAQQALSQLR